MMTRAGACAFLLALLAGCATGDGWLGEDRQAIALVNYANRVAAMSAGEQRREREWAQAAQAKDKSALARVRLGLLYALPSSAIQDDARALTLLEASDPAPAGAVAQIAQLVAAQVRDRQRQMQEEQRKGDALRQQLDALKAIERSILERGERRRQERR